MNWYGAELLIFITYSILTLPGQAINLDQIKSQDRTYSLKELLTKGAVTKKV